MSQADWRRFVEIGGLRQFEPRDRRTAVPTQTPLDKDEYYDLGPANHLFNVVWQKPNGEVHETEVEARHSADAAWRVAEQVFDCIHPLGRQLIDVITLR